MQESVTKTNLMRTVMTLAALVAIASPLTQSKGAELQGVTMKNMNLKLTVGDHVLTSALEDNATSRDFASLLPLTLTLKDYASTEKISDLPKRLSTHGAPEGSVPQVGDVAYYAPSGNLAIFHKDFKYSSGLINLAHFNGDIAALTVDGPVTVRIELAALDQTPVNDSTQETIPWTRLLPYSACSSAHSQP